MCYPLKWSAGCEALALVPPVVAGSYADGDVAWRAAGSGDEQPGLGAGD